MHKVIITVVIAKKCDAVIKKCIDMVKEQQELCTCNM